jgi:hypothetical protein
LLSNVASALRVNSTLEELWWPQEFQHRYFGALFGQALFDETQLDFGQASFQHGLVATDVPLMVAQTGNSVVHNKRPLIDFFDM